MKIISQINFKAIISIWFQDVLSKKRIFALIVILFSTCRVIYSQDTNNPYCYSNASALTIEKISITDYNTVVDLKFYTTDENYNFWISSGMYIQKYGEPYSSKYYIKEFVGCELDTKYKNKAYTTYHFTWKFEKIPKGLTNINILEPEASNATAWYWENITINNPNQYKSYSYSSNSLSDFFYEKGLALIASLAHPTNTYKSGSFQIYSDYVWVTIYYDGYTMELKIAKNGNLFTRIETISDDDFLSPFTVIGLTKNIIYNLIRNDKDTEQKNVFQRYLNKTISDMDGEDLACLALTLNLNQY